MKIPDRLAYLLNEALVVVFTFNELLPLRLARSDMKVLDHFRRFSYLTRRIKPSCV